MRITHLFLRDVLPLGLLLLALTPVDATPPRDPEEYTLFLYATATTSAAQRQAFQSFRFGSLASLRGKLIYEPPRHGNLLAAAEWEIGMQLKSCSYALKGYLFAKKKNGITPPDTDLDTILEMSQLAADLIDDPTPVSGIPYPTGTPPITNSRVSELYMLGEVGSLLMLVGQERDDEGLILLGLEWLERARGFAGTQASVLPSAPFAWEDGAPARNTAVQTFLVTIARDMTPRVYSPIKNNPAKTVARNNYTWLLITFAMMVVVAIIWIVRKPKLQ